MERALQLPAPDLSPPAEAPINLGLWLAVEEQQPVVASVNIVGLYAEVRADHASTTFTIDDATTISCDGIGTPIVDLDAIDEGECGYTFTRADEVGDHTITVTMTWEITYRTPFGDGTLPDLTRSTSVPYHVYEIVTVGGS